MLCHPVPDREETQEGKQMKILVCSCDRNWDLWMPFHHCMEKYWNDHPEIIYKTETKDNPYYKTIKNDYLLTEWTKGIRETLAEIDDDQILLLMDDIFIRQPVDTERIKYASENLKGNIALMNFEKSFDLNDKPTDLEGFKKRMNGSPWVVSIMCGLWQKEKLIQVISDDCTPWDVESRQNTCGFDYYINSGDYIIDWGYKTYRPVGIVRGCWSNETLEFLNAHEGLTIEWNGRGLW